MLSRIPLTPALARDANAGMHLEVLAGSTPFFRAPIVAVTCQASCEAWLQLSPSEHRLLATADPSTLQAVIVIPPSAATASMPTSR